MLTEACGDIGVALGNFAVSLTSAQSGVGENKLGRPLMGRLATVLNVFYL